MSAQPTILDSKPPTDEQKRLLAVFDDMERKQVDFLQEAGKRIIELLRRRRVVVEPAMPDAGEFAEGERRQVP